MHTIQYSISTTKYFDTQKQMAEWLAIKGADKKAIHKECKLWGWGVNFDNYFGEYNRKFGFND